MALSKLEIQQMLREMNVKFHADATYDELMQRLQQEHHSLWLKSGSRDRPASGGAEKAVVKKRKKAPSSETPAADPTSPSVDSRRHAKPSPHSAPVRSGRPEPTYRPLPVDKPEPGKPWKAAADGTEPFNRKKNVFESVLKRAGLCCERCGKPSDDTSGATDLQPFHIQPLAQGGEHSIKNAVALCPTCLETMHDDPNPKDIKELKRKTRSKLYDSLEVVRKKAGRRRGRWPRKLK